MANFPVFRFSFVLFSIGEYMANNGNNLEPPPHKSDILDAIADAAESFQLQAPIPPPKPGPAEEAVVIKVLDRIIEQNRRRATRNSKEGILQCFTIKVPAHELQTLRKACAQHEIYMTDFARFLMMSHIALLDAPTQKVRPKLDQIRTEVEARREKAVARENARKNPALEQLAS
jgi:hypothetical protein